MHPCPQVDRAEGLYIYDKQQKRYMDMVSGVAVNNIGHSHPHVVQAIKDQLDRHMHVMVYGEYIQDAQLRFSDTLRGLLPPALNCVYPVNSGTEANEAALKLAKRVTGRRELVAFRGAYHGATHGSMSISSSAIKARTAAFEPLLPEVRASPWGGVVGGGAGDLRCADASATLPHTPPKVPSGSRVRQRPSALAVL